MSEISSSYYFFMLDFSNNVPEITTWTTSYAVKAININPEYSKFLLALRYTFVFLSLVSNFLFIKRIKMLQYSDLIIEQKLLFLIGILLIFFNDPFSGVTALYPNMATFHLYILINFFIY